MAGSSIGGGVHVRSGGCRFFHSDRLSRPGTRGGRLGGANSVGDGGGGGRRDVLPPGHEMAGRWWRRESFEILLLCDHPSADTTTMTKRAATVEPAMTPDRDAGSSSDLAWGAGDVSAGVAGCDGDASVEKKVWSAFNTQPPATHE